MLYNGRKGETVLDCGQALLSAAPKTIADLLDDWRVHLRSRRSLGGAS